MGKLLGRTLTAIAAGGVVLAMAACGGSDSPAATNTTGVATATASPRPATQTQAVSPTPAAVVTPVSSPLAGGGAGVTVDVTEKDFALSLDQPTAVAGAITFNVQNDGPSTHEFVVFQTDLQPDQLPVDPDVYAVVEDSPGVTHIDEIEDIEANSTESLTVNLTPGRYVLICNLPTHYRLGMYVGFSVQ